MRDEDKTKRQLMNELAELHTRVAELREIENQWKKREKVPQSERDRLGKVLQDIGVGVAIISKDFRTVWANSVLKRWFGPDIEGKVCYLTYNNRDQICPGCGVHEIFETGKDLVVHEQVGEDADGNVLWSQITATPIKDRKGKITEALEIVMPITKRKRAEKALRESEDRFKQFFENAPTYCYMISPEGVILDVNRSAVKTLGYKKEELVGKPLKAVYAPESLPKMKQVFVNWTETGEIQDEELVIITKEGNRRTVLLSAGVVRYKDGKILHSVSVQKDITERKRAEEVLRKKEAELTEESRHLEEVNTALKVLLQRREKDKIELGENLLAHVRELVLPYLEKLKRSQSESHQMTLVGILESNLGDIVSPFVTNLSSRYLNLTPTEIQVASLIRDGRTTKEIGALLHLSANTIMSHRYHIRSKLGLKNKKVNLRSYLQSLHV